MPHILNSSVGLPITKKKKKMSAIRVLFNGFVRWIHEMKWNEWLLKKRQNDDHDDHE